MRTLFALLMMLTLFIPQTGFAEDSTIKGKYKVIGDLAKLKGLKQVEIEEYFNYSCGHCYKFLETSEKLHKQFKGKVFHKKVPIYWGNQTPYPAMAYYIADQHGIEKKFTRELFDTNFLMEINIFQPRVIKLLSRDHGIEKEITSGMQSPEIKQKVDQGMAKAKQLEINETPTVIINGVLKVTPSISGGSVELMTDNLAVILEDLLKQ